MSAICNAQQGGLKRKERKEKKRQDYTFWRQFNEKPSIIPGCPVQGGLQKWVLTFQEVVSGVECW